MNKLYKIKRVIHVLTKRSSWDTLYTTIVYNRMYQWLLQFKMPIFDGEGNFDVSNDVEFWKKRNTVKDEVKLI